MNREIIFRGKTTDNHIWIYGDLLKESNGTCNIVYAYNGGTLYKADVIPDTIGQFTGLYDKNGKEIYEGDIVNFNDTPYNPYADPYTGKVMFYKGYWSVEIVRYGELVHPYLFRGDFAGKKTTILGNIHDNPELIKEE